MSSLDAMARLLAPLKRRISNLVARGVVERVDDGSQVQVVQVTLLANEVRSGLERVQQYGFTSVPQEGAEAVALFLGGARDHGVVLAVEDRRYRLKGLESGEVAIYTDEGDRIHFQRGGTILVKAGAKVVVDAPAVELAGTSDAALKGTTYRTAEDTLLTALATYAAAIKGVADPSNAATPALTAAISTFQAASAAYLSTKVKVG